MLCKLSCALVLEKFDLHVFYAYAYIFEVSISASVASLVTTILPFISLRSTWLKWRGQPYMIAMWLITTTSRVANRVECNSRRSTPSKTSMALPNVDYMWVCAMCIMVLAPKTDEPKVLMVMGYFTLPARCTRILPLTFRSLRKTLLRSIRNVPLPVKLAPTR